MASIRLTAILGTVMAVAVFLVGASTVQPSPVAAPEPSPLDCKSYLLDVSDCLSYVEADSNATEPERGCCPELAGLVETHPICLCQFLTNNPRFGIQISLSKALNLPAACGLITTPSTTLCSGAGYAIGVSMPSEAPEGLAGSPASENNDSGASSIAVSQILSLFLVCLPIPFLSTFFST
ncbi:non-specific lipid transfer protein GPI-anchored 12-like isoform X1 [Actinidia eriantha]|uniref:non-specific lipid transfer protein GPI-anchored 12-like isoform X1 n=1 Tax=Actinidia eriantha TaxID=165200 RepID=UPI002584A33A|nr:non-specific lipid transfer protein GPI-anchored 12-like isoform X1 [Actinidia eriantha]